MAMSCSPHRQPAIAGIGQTRFTRYGEQAHVGALGLAIGAVEAALEDAGLSAGDLDGFATFPDEGLTPSQLQAGLGMDGLRYSGQAWAPGGSGSCASVHLAATAIRSGAANCVVVVRAFCPSADDRYSRFNPKQPYINFGAPFGLLSPASMIALAMRRHMHEHGTTREQLAAWALACRVHANRNPHALFFDRPLTLEDYFASRMIADPFCLFDCCLETDGACAIIVTSMERARDCRAKPVAVLASAQGGDRGYRTGHLGGVNMDDAMFLSMGGWGLAAELYGQAGIDAADIDVAQIYDAFTGMALMALEDMGFCGVGESGPFVQSGATRWPDGATPMNTAGGLLSEAYVHGLNLVTEAARQIRGGSTAQVDGAELSLVVSVAGFAPVSGLVLGNAP